MIILAEVNNVENSTSLMGSLHGLCDWIMRFSIINMLWIIFNIPNYLSNYTNDILQIQKKAIMS